MRKRSAPTKYVRSLDTTLLPPLRRRADLAAFFVLQDSEFCAPIRQRQTESRQIGMPREDHCFDFRDLADAAGDSCVDSRPFGFDLRERAAVAVKRRLLARELLPPHHTDVNVSRIDVDSETDPLREFGCHHR